MSAAFEAYLNKVHRVYANNPQLRYGQTLFNTLYAFDPEFANKIRGSDLDPYYTNDVEKFNIFLNAVISHWDGIDHET
jgi:hypothetical protein